MTKHTYSVRAKVWSDTFYWARKGYINLQAKSAIALLLMALVIIVLPHFLSVVTFEFVALAVTLGLVVLLIVSGRGARQTARMFGNARVCAFRPVATPLTSVFSALDRESVHFSDIKSLSIETSTINDFVKYADGDGKIIHQFFEENPDGCITVYGYDNRESAPKNISSKLSGLGEKNIKYKNVGSKPIAHRTLIYTKRGKTYLWYEDEHRVEKGHHYFPNGAYLFEVSDAVAKKVADDVSHGRPTIRP